MFSERILIRQLEPGFGTPHPQQGASGRSPRATDAFSCWLVEGRKALRPAQVLDLSPHGIRLFLNQRIEPGAIVGVEWHSERRQLPCFLLTIIHGTMARPDGGWVVAGRFARKLNPEELLTLR